MTLEPSRFSHQKRHHYRIEIGWNSITRSRDADLSYL